MRKTLVRGLFVLVFVFLILGCGGVTDNGGNHTDDPNDEIIGSDLLKFNLTGAKAVGTSGINASRGGDDEFALIKILSDGSIEPAMEISEDQWFPAVRFIAKSPISQDLFISFEEDIFISYQKSDQEWGVENCGNFLHVLPDGTYYIICINENGNMGNVMNETWYGDDDFKPVVFDSAGNAYFIKHSFLNGKQITVLCKYDVASHSTTDLTVAIPGYSYESIQITSDGAYLFVKGCYSGSSASSDFFRMYPISNMDTPMNIAYSSNNTTWVKGYKIDPESRFLIMNGNNIRGITGILKAGNFSAQKLTYTAIYSSENEEFEPVFRVSEDSQNNQIYKGLFDKYELNSLHAVITDGTKIGYCDVSSFLEDEQARNSSSLTVDFGSGGSLYKIGSEVWFAQSLEDPDAGTDNTAASYTGFAETGGDLLLMRKCFVEQTYEYFPVPDSLMPCIEENLNTLHWNTDALYLWNEHWYMNQDASTGELDAAAIDEYVGQFFTEDAEFVFNGERGNEAYVEALAWEPFLQQEICGEDLIHPEYLLTTYFKITGTDEAVSTLNGFKEENDLPWLNFETVENMFFDEEGGLWGVLKYWDSNVYKPVPVKLLNSAGERQLQAINIFAGNEYFPVGFVMEGEYMYFRNAMREDGIESGNHQILRFPINFTGIPDSSIVEDVLVNVPNNGHFEILDYSIGGGFVYFTGVTLSGAIVGGKVDLETLSFTPFSESYRLTNIEVY